MEIRRCLSYIIHVIPCAGAPQAPISGRHKRSGKRHGHPDRNRDPDRPRTLTLEPPQPLQIVQPEQAAGLVPLKEEQKSQLEEKVDTFVAELVALDSNSPDFGKKVDQLTTMGRKEIAEAAGPFQPLPRPAGQGDRQATPASAPTSPSCAGRSRISTRRAASEPAAPAVRLHPVRQQAARLFHEIPVGADPHRRDPRRARLGQGRAAAWTMPRSTSSAPTCGRRWASSSR